MLRKSCSPCSSYTGTLDYIRPYIVINGMLRKLLVKSIHNTYRKALVQPSLKYAANIGV